jgi:hypothetical protein
MTSIPAYLALKALARGFRHPVSAREKTGLDSLRYYLNKVLRCFFRLSGVGQVRSINALIGNDAQATGEVREVTAWEALYNPVCSLSSPEAVLLSITRYARYTIRQGT